MPSPFASDGTVVRRAIARIARWRQTDAGGRMRQRFPSFIELHFISSNIPYLDMTFSLRLLRALSFLAPLFVSLLMSVNTAQAASFDCKKAKSPVEQAICLDGALSAYDERMKRLYDEALLTAPDELHVKQAQRDWLRLVRNRCLSIECLLAAYAGRIAALSSGKSDEVSELSTQVGANPALKPGEVEFQPASADLYKQIAAWLQQVRVLDAALKSVARYVPRESLPSITARQCGNGGGAYYTSRLNQVVICYEFLASLFDYQNSQVRQGVSTSPTEANRALAAIKFVALHEIGHALLHRNRAAGSLGPEEAEADNFAGVMLLAEAQTDKEVQEAVWAVQRLTFTFGMKNEYSWNEYADEHPVPQQRLAAFACLTAGRMPILSAWLGKILPESRARRCATQWPRALAGVNTLLARMHPTTPALK